MTNISIAKKAICFFALCFTVNAFADSVGALTLNYSRTSAGISAGSSSVTNSVVVPGTYSFSHSLNYTTGVVSGSSFAFIDDYIFSVPVGEVSSVATAIDLTGLIGINNLQMRLFSVPNASAPGTAGTPSGSWILANNTNVSCGPACTTTVSVISTQPLAAGTYSLQIMGNVESYGGSYSGTFVTTAPVPVPAGLPLLLSGLGMLGVMMRRKQEV